MTATIAEHAREVRRTRDTRRMADQAVTALREWEQSPEEMQNVRRLIAEYRIPGGSWQKADEPLSCDGWLQVVDESRGMKNARSTLRNRLGIWKKVRAFLRMHSETSGKQWCVAWWTSPPHPSPGRRPLGGPLPPLESPRRRG